MTEHDKPSADERDAVERENIKAEFYRLNRETRVPSTTILVHMVLAERRDANRRVEEAFRAGYRAGEQDVQASEFRRYVAGCDRAFSDYLAAQAPPRVAL